MRGKKKATALLSSAGKLLLAMAILLVASFALYLYHLPSQRQHITVPNPLEKLPQVAVENKTKSAPLSIPTPPRITIEDPSTLSRPDVSPPNVAPQPVKSMMEIVEELFLLGKSDPMKLAHTLENENPLSLSSTPESFTCPSDLKLLISFPSFVNETRAEDFRAGKAGTWLFYQHLRKAGGTGFCDLAQNNLPRHQTPPYFCMIDNRGSLATSPWNDEEYLMSRMERAHYRITANEWDAYYPYMGQWRGAVLATTFRHPVDRWYSQYRFEHLEHRDGSSQDAPRRPFKTWYNNNKGWTMGLNYYVTTFIGFPDHEPYNKGDFYWTYHKYQRMPMTYEMFHQSLQNILTFHLVLVTEWLDSSAPLIEEVLGWKTPPKQVLPHESNAAKRDASYRKIPTKEVVGEVDYSFVLHENIFDLLLFHVVKRIYLERLHHCHEVAS